MNNNSTMQSNISNKPNNMNVVPNSMPSAGIPIQQNKNMMTKIYGFVMNLSVECAKLTESAPGKRRAPPGEPPGIRHVWEGTGG